MPLLIKMRKREGIKERKKELQLPVTQCTKTTFLTVGTNLNLVPCKM